MLRRAARAPRVATRATFRDAARRARSIRVSPSTFRRRASYTGEDVLELHGHGGPGRAAAPARALHRSWARALREPGEFTQRAFLNGKLDLAQAESVADLIDAATATAARAAARSLSGAFSNEIRRARRGADRAADVHRGHARLSRRGHRVPARRRRAQAGSARSRRRAAAGARARAKQGALLREGLAVVLVGRAQRRQVEPPEPARRRRRGDRHADPRHDARRRRPRRSKSAASRSRSSTPRACARPTIRSKRSASSARGRRSRAPISRSSWSMPRRRGALTDDDAAILDALARGAAAARRPQQDRPRRSSAHGRRRPRRDRRALRCADGAPRLPVGEDRRGHRSAAAGNPRARRRARGHGRHVSRPRAPSRCAARGGDASRGRARRTSPRRSRRSSSSPKICAARTRRSRRLPASSRPTICWGRSSPASASASDGAENGLGSGAVPRVFGRAPAARARSSGAHRVAAPATVVDLGCGAGNVTALLANAGRRARIIGIDNSKAMLADGARLDRGVRRARMDRRRHRKLCPERAHRCRLQQCGACIGRTTTRSLFPRLFGWVAPGGVLAVQMPDQFAAPSHVALAEVVASTQWQKDRLAGRVKPFAVLPACGLFSSCSPRRRPRSMPGRPNICMFCARPTTACIRWLPG